MLQHEQAPPTAPLNYAPPNYTPITPYELAQAVVAVEDRQESGTQATIDPAVIRQTLEQGRMDVTPEQLLKEVQMQRSIAHQDAAMTRRKNRNLPLWLLTGATIVTSLVAAALFVINVAITRQYRMTSAALETYQIRESVRSKYDTAPQLLSSWSFPGAKKLSSSDDSHLAFRNMTLTVPYTLVWKYYLEQVGYRDETLMQQINTTGKIPDMERVGKLLEDGQSVDYMILSKSTGAGATATFTRHTPYSTLTATIVHNARSGENKISAIAATP